jgi:hypothetical protein
VTSAEAVPAALGARWRWVMPLEGAAISGGDRAGPGECLLIPPGAPLTLAPGSLALVGAAGGLSA